ncbi:TspO/MBR family protein [Sphingomonas sp.]|uniref:TspO/MBR family protein n=1 Tax=Sphingomonas sp. TaxID=28214 RepID=UPI002DEA5403|nr:TspO/MBR family protein [Sphingomonas sp.]
MSEIASREQLRGALLRRALVTVPAVLLLGMLSGRLANSGYDNQWFAMLTKPEAMPPGWAFGAAWTVLYILQGLALAMILNARGNRLRGSAVTLFVVQLALNLAWSPLFFGLHQVTAALWLIGAIFLAALATTLVFGRIRPLAAWLMLPYLAWLCFAAALNNDIRRLNPDAEQLVPGFASTQIER